MYESDHIRKWINPLRKQGVLYLKIHGHRMQAPGWPDVLLLYKDFYCFIEFKLTSDVTPLQRRIISLIKDTGFPAFVGYFVGKHLIIDQNILKSPQELFEFLRCHANIRESQTKNTSSI